MVGWTSMAKCKALTGSVVKGLSLGIFGNLKTTSNCVAVDQRHARVVVFEGPRWVGKKLSPIIASPASNTLTLRCPAAGDPSPNITWLKDDEPLAERYMGSVSSALNVFSAL